MMMIKISLISIMVILMVSIFTYRDDIAMETCQKRASYETCFYAMHR
jgi:hypothetical protein